MKVLLIHASLPEAGNIERRGRALFPSLCLTHVAALFPHEYEIVLVNDIVEEIPFEDDFDLIGITFYGIAAARAFAIAKQFRDRDIPVVFGGPTATTLPELCHPHCDSLVIGEAEDVMPRLVSDLESGCLARSYVAEQQADVAHLPVPRYDLLDPAHYVGIYPVQTARGCVFRCSFCSIPELNNFTVRYRPIGDVIRDIEAAVASSGTRQIFFVDDNINMNPRRAVELFEALVPLRIEWYSYATSLIAKQPKVLKLAAESGCKGLLIGFESLSQDALKAVNKLFNHPSDYCENIAIIHDHGIHIAPSFVFGLDGDGPGVFQRTFEFIESNRLSLPIINVLTPGPGTATFNQLNAEGRIVEKDLKRFDSRHVVFQPQRMSIDELEHGIQWIRRSVYSIASILQRVVFRKPIGGWRNWRMQLRVAIINFHYWRLERQGVFGARADAKVGFPALRKL